MSKVYSGNINNSHLSMKRELALLVLQTRKYLRQEDPEYFENLEQASSNFSRTTAKTVLENKIEHSSSKSLQEKVKEIEEKPLKGETENKLIKKVPAPNKENKDPKTSKWKLELSRNPSEPEKLMSKLEPFIRLRPTSIPIYLALAEENDPHRLFLENVSKALTRYFLPASVQLYENVPKSAQLIIAPFKLFEKKFEKLKIHCFFQDNGRSFLPLDHLDKYMNDRNLKVSLWNALKSYPFHKMTSKNTLQ